MKYVVTALFILGFSNQGLAEELDAETSEKIVADGRKVYEVPSERRYSTRLAMPWTYFAYQGKMYLCHIYEGTNAIAFTVDCRSSKFPPVEE